MAKTRRLFRVSQKKHIVSCLFSEKNTIFAAQLCLQNNIIFNIVVLATQKNKQYYEYTIRTRS